ncbi:hypothetical protein C4K16_2478 [Pseudomonas chlororaphis subsp. aurantiaca]|nr:hypothetical protein C4K16_2478 [Pseudomonas chlororaphis subsp. aurantiaca]
MTCSRCRRLRSRPKGAQGLKIAEQPSAAATGLLSVGARLARDGG